ncbi:MAG: hypothetical protein FWF15_04820 [Oscillospiraceae bacterium]|nr:hypothetical protein [Oscillospiraceae bacterium]
MILDCHIHSGAPEQNNVNFLEKLNEAGIDGGIVFSKGSWQNNNSDPDYNQKRLEQVIDFVKISGNLYPFYYLDPTEPDAIGQVDNAITAGIRGFKVICRHFYPFDERAIPVWKHIASKNKPILFHSGILYSQTPSTDYNRPGNFDHLLNIDGLKFAMAHISWPWIDECIALFGKWNSNRNNLTSQLFIDIAPGTPPIYRRDALTKLLTVGYVTFPKRILFGVDSSTHHYDSDYAKSVIERDNSIYDELNISGAVRAQIYEKNLLEFIGY